MTSTNIWLKAKKLPEFKRELARVRALSHKAGRKLGSKEGYSKRMMEENSCECCEFDTVPSRKLSFKEKIELLLS